MKRIFSILMIGVFLFDLFGHMSLFFVAQMRIQKEIKTLLKNSVPESQLHLISVLEKDVEHLNWEEDGKEFMQNGVMYDIVHKVIRDGKVYFYCFPDKKESELFARLDDAVQQKMEVEKSAMNSTFKSLLKLMVSLPEINIKTRLPKIDNLIRHNTVHSSLYGLVFLATPTPPPKHSV